MTISSVGTQESMSLQEMLSLMQEGTNSSASTEAFGEAMSEKLMDEFDADGDGSLSEDELASLVEKLEGMRDMMASMQMAGMGGQGPGGPGGPGGGEDGGGLLGSLMQELEDSGESEAADTNGDGMVTPDELMDYFGIDQSEAPSGPPPAGPPPDGADAGSGESLSEAAAGSTSTTSEADLNEDGVVSSEEWAEFFGVSEEELSGSGASSANDRKGSDMSALLRRAVQAYQQAYGEESELEAGDVSSLTGVA